MRPKACIACRQIKLRCEYDKGGAGSCHRCLKRGLQCVYDPKYRHTPKRKRLSQATSGIDEGSILVSAPSGPPKYVDDTTCLDAAKVNSTFQLFFEKYLPHFPISINNDIEGVYSKSPLLFWTICSIVYSDDSSILAKIRNKVKDLVTEVFQSPPVRSIETIQALLLLCVWPLPYRTVLSDASFTYSNLATQYGQQMGLHRPAYAFEYSSKSQVAMASVKSRLETWIGCFVISSFQASRLGNPGYVSPDSHFLRVLESSSMVNPVLRLLGKLADFLNSINQALGFDGESESGLVEYHARVRMVKRFAIQLDAMKEQCLENNLEAYFLCCKLSLFSYVLDEKCANDPQSGYLLEIVTGDCLRIIDIIEEVEQQYLPFWKMYFTVYACLFLLKLDRDMLCTIDRPSVLSSVDKVNYMISRLERLKGGGEKHFLTSSSNLLGRLSAITSDLKVMPCIQSRGSANLLYDSIRVANENNRMAREPSQLHNEKSNEAWMQELLSFLEF